MEHWYSWHLFYSGELELLIGKIKPLTEKLIAEGAINSFFFIRYWEGGAHVRLRLLSDHSHFETSVKPLLFEEIETFFRDQPSVRELPNLLQKTSLYPNDSIQLIDYQPEVKRYGGLDAVKIAERQFFFSSRAVLEIITTAKTWSYNRALGAALQLNLAFSFSVGMTLMEAYEFHKMCYNNWFPLAYSEPNDPSGPEQLISKRTEVLKSFESNFERQKEVLIAFTRAIWEELSQGHEFDNQWMNDWITGMKEVKEKLDLLELENRLFVSENHMPSSINKKWSIYISYVHMSNNRLGVLNRDEGYLGYILSNCLKIMIDKSTL